MSSGGERLGCANIRRRLFRLSGIGVFRREARRLLGIPPAVRNPPVWLEKYLESQLNVEGLPGTNAGGAVVIANGIGDTSETTAATETDTSVNRVYVGRRKVSAIQEIEEFHAELGCDSFGNIGVLEDREVHRTVTRSVELVAWKIPEGSIGRLGERRRVDPLDIFAVRPRNDGVRNSGERITN